MKRKKSSPRVKQHARLVVYPQIVQWPSCEADIRTLEAINFRRREVPAKRIMRLAQRGIGELQCGNLGSYTIDGCWFCRKHAGLILLDLLAEPAQVTP